MSIYKYVLDNHIEQPVQLEIGLDKVVYDRARNGKDARYFTVRIDGKNVTQMIAEAVGLKVSRARETYGSLIIHGTGMDMGFALQYRMYSAACQAGYPDMFDRDDYRYLGKRIPGGKNEYRCK